MRSCLTLSAAGVAIVRCVLLAILLGPKAACVLAADYAGDFTCSRLSVVLLRPSDGCFTFVLGRFLRLFIGCSLAHIMNPFGATCAGGARHCA